MDRSRPRGSTTPRPGAAARADADLADRVLAAILAYPRIDGRDPSVRADRRRNPWVPTERRTATRRRHRLGLVVLLTVLSLVGPRALELRVAHAGPIESRAAYVAARARRDGPWQRYTQALQAVVRGARRTDPTRTRALGAWAQALDRAGLPLAACAAWAHTTRSAPRGDAAGERARVAQARVLYAECDDEAALTLLRTAPERGARLLSTLLLERRDAEGLRELLRQRLDAALQIHIWGRLGELYLGAGARRRAERCLREAERIVDGLGRRSDRDAHRAVRVWLGLPLRERLAS